MRLATRTCLAALALLTLAASQGEFQRIAQRLREGDTLYWGRGPMLALQARLEDPDLASPERFLILLRLTGLEAQQGLAEQATRHIDEALALLQQPLARAPEGSEIRNALAAAQRARAVAYMRLAEDANCVAHRDPESCIFPIEGGGVHGDPGPSREALRSLERYLELRPDDFGARWLLNVVAMTLGRHPAGVAERWRIDFGRRDPDSTMPRFVDAALPAGVGAVDLAGGVAVEDFDGDGRLDVITTTSDPFGPMHYFRNRGDGSFEERAGKAGLDGQLGGLNLIAGDYDGDGDPDLLVLRGAWQLGDGRIRNSLLRNEGGRFVDVTRRAGLADPAMPTQTAAWGDYDHDGDLDLYVGNEASPEHGLDFPSQLFRNDGPDGFTDVARSAGVANMRYAKGVAWGDYDDDGDLDLYVSNIGANRLYRNRGNGTFEDVADKLGVTGPEGRSFACWFFDYDNDGDLDLFVGAYDAEVDDLARDRLGLEDDGARPALYRNDGEAGFRDVARSSGLDHPWLPMGAGFGDIDGDGFLDVYLGTGDPSFETLVPNVMLRNRAGRGFEDVTLDTGLGHLQKGHGVAFADLDGDGDEDIYHQLGGFYPGDRFGNALFRNDGARTHWIDLELQGVESNRQGIGARIALTLRRGEAVREIHRAQGSVSSFGGSPLGRMHIALGDAARVLELRVEWPRSGVVSVYRDLPADRRYLVREGAATAVAQGQSPADGIREAPPEALP